MASSVGEIQRLNQLKIAEDDVMLKLLICFFGMKILETLSSAERSRKLSKEEFAKSNSALKNIRKFGITVEYFPGRSV